MRTVSDVVLSTYSLDELVEMVEDEELRYWIQSAIRGNEIPLSREEELENKIKELEEEVAELHSRMDEASSYLNY